jgi:hypothetical protein
VTNEANATGTASNGIEHQFFIGFDGRRVATDRSGQETGFAILTAAPNPFNGRTTLSFTSTEDGPYLAGGIAASAPVRLLFEGSVEAGRRHQYPFDGAALSPGPRTRRGIGPPDYG